MSTPKDLREELRNLVGKYLATHLGTNINTHQPHIIPEQGKAEQCRGCQCMIPIRTTVSHDDGYGDVHKLEVKIYRNPATDPCGQCEWSYGTDVMILVEQDMSIISKDQVESLLFDSNLVGYFIKRGLLTIENNLVGCACNYRSFLKVLDVLDNASGSGWSMDRWSKLFMAVIERPPTFDKSETKQMILKMLGCLPIGGYREIFLRSGVLCGGTLEMMTKEKFIDDQLLMIMVDMAIPYDSEITIQEDILWRIENIGKFKRLMSVDQGTIRKCLISYAYRSRNPEVIDYVLKDLMDLDRVELATREMSAARFGVMMTKGIRQSSVRGKIAHASELHPCEKCGIVDNIPFLLAAKQKRYVLPIASRKCRRIFNMLIDSGYRPSIKNLDVMLEDSELDMTIRFIRGICTNVSETTSMIRSLCKRSGPSYEKVSIMIELVNKGVKFGMWSVRDMILFGGEALRSYVLGSYMSGPRGIGHHFDINSTIFGRNLLTTGDWVYESSVVKAIIDKGIDLDFVDVNGRSALYMGGQVECLCDAGANPNIVDQEGITPLEYHLSRPIPETEEVMHKLKESMCDNLVLSYAAMLTEDRRSYNGELIYGTFLELVSPI